MECLIETVALFMIRLKFSATRERQWTREIEWMRSEETPIQLADGVHMERNVKTRLVPKNRVRLEALTRKSSDTLLTALCHRKQRKVKTVCTIIVIPIPGTVPTLTIIPIPVPETSS